MAKRRFQVSWFVEVELELDDKVIEVVDDDWRKHLYPLHTPEDIAEHIAYNLVVNRAKLTQLDGWADLDDSMAKLTSEDHDEAEIVELEVER